MQSSNDIERRFCTTLEVRQSGREKARLVGYAALFNSRSLDLGGFIEIIRPGAFKRTLAAGTDVLAFVEHNPESIIGRRSTGTLELAEDDKGLRVEIRPPDTSAGRDVVENVRAGILDAMSFAFKIPDMKTGQRWNLDEEPALRELLELSLREVSVVALPAYPETEIALRSLTESRKDWKPAPKLEELRKRLEARK